MHPSLLTGLGAIIHRYLLAFFDIEQIMGDKTLLLAQSEKSKGWALPHGNGLIPGLELGRSTPTFALCFPVFQGNSMTELFILQNQQQLFLGKHNNWVDGRDPSAVFKTAYKDEAINQMVETSSKDYQQRIRIINCSSNDKGLPVIDPAILPPPLPKPVKEGVRGDNLEQADAVAVASTPDAADTALQQG
jgi:hypothetical protein